MYKAFISYSHAVDGKLAPAVQTALENFAKPWYKIRYFNVFRDEASLSANPHLWSNIQAALENSEYLIYLASPVSAASKWVCKEVEYWVEHKTIDKLLVVLTEGEISWDDTKKSFLNAETNSLPTALENIFTEEPFYIDLRYVRTETDLSLRNPIFKKEILKLAAPLHGKEPKDLASEEVTAHRKMIRIRNSAIGVLSFLFIAACIAAWLANKNKNEAIRERNIAQANYLISEAKGAVETDPALALRLAEQAMLMNKDTNIEKAATKMYRENPFDEIHQLKNYPAFEDDALSIALSSDGNSMLAGTWDTYGKGAVSVLDRNGNITKQLERHAAGVIAVAFSPDKKMALAGCHDNIARLWDLENNTMQEYKGHTAPLTSVAFSPDGQTILTGSEDHTARLWNLHGDSLRVFKSPEGSILSVAFSPDGQTILTGSKNGAVCLWDIHGTGVHLFTGLPGTINSVAFSPNGKMILAGSSSSGTEEGAARLWDIRGNTLQTFNQLHTTVHTVTFSPNSQMIFIGADAGILAAGTGYTGLLWDIKGNIIKEYEDLMRSVGSVAFSPDNKTIIVSAGLLYKLDVPLSLEEFLKSDRIKPLSPEQKKQYGIN